MVRTWVPDLLVGESRASPHATGLMHNGPDMGARPAGGELAEVAPERPLIALMPGMGKGWLKIPLEKTPAHMSKRFQ
jgi:hypothetical protein